MDITLIFILKESYVMLCKLCGKELGKRSKVLCGECYTKKYKVKCINCEKEYEVRSHFFLKLDLSTHECKQCKLCGTGNPNYGKRWSDEQKIVQSKLMSSKVNENTRLNSSKGMKGKHVSEETMNKRRETNKLKILNGFKSPTHTEEQKKQIGIKSSLKFTKEYKERMRIVNEKNGTWTPLEIRDEYHLYREFSNWKYQVLTENTIGIEKLKTMKLYDKTNRNKDALVRDHMYGRSEGFKNGVFPEIIRHPANCQIISHGENIKKSKSNNDSIISFIELSDRIKKWNLPYEEQELCVDLLEKYERGLKYEKNNYIKNIYENN
jgi:hypothetical protein